MMTPAEFLANVVSTLNSLGPIQVPLKDRIAYILPRRAYIDGAIPSLVEFTECIFEFDLTETRPSMEHGLGRLYAEPNALIAHDGRGAGVDEDLPCLDAIDYGRWIFKRSISVEENVKLLVKTLVENWDERDKPPVSSEEHAKLTKEKDQVALLRDLLDLIGDGALFCSGDWPTLVAVNCNDLFAPGCADAEDIGPGDVQLIEAARCDLEKALKDTSVPLYLSLSLFASRKRGVRPQQPWLKRREPKVRELFEAVGPDRKERIA